MSKEDFEEEYDQRHCEWCGEIWPKSEMRKELNMGWLCRDCQAALYSRGEKGVYEN